MSSCAGLISKIAARNDDDAARRLFLMYRAELLGFGVHVLHDQGLAEEMVQETFIKLWQQDGSYDTSRGPGAGLAVHDSSFDRPRHRPPPVVPAIPTRGFPVAAARQRQRS